MDDELERLGLKLLETLHLNVPERRAIPASGLPMSALATALATRLEADGWFPSPAHDDSIWTGARLELRGSEIWVHERHEIGLARLGPIRSQPAGSLGDAIRRYVDANGGSPLDGVLIDWRA